MKKVYRKRLTRSILILLPLLVVAGILVYVKLRGFQEALEQLVEAESSGQYALTIDESSIDILEQGFTFNDISIRRTASAPKRGIDVVRIPYLQIRFGSIVSMLRVRRFDIERCIIEEPIIEIDATGRQVDASKEGITLSQQIIQLYPAVQALLGRFEIKSLTVNRASVGMNNEARSPLKLSLIDLLVEQWNIKSLTDESQLQLKVGGQDLNFGKAGLKFSGIEFNFQRHHLLFSDFDFTSLDSLSSSRINISGKSLILRELDYNDLYENKRYSIKKAEVDRPQVNLHLRLKKRHAANVDERTTITRLLKHSVGECSVDSTIIRDARVHIVLEKDRDSVRIDLPRVNFKLSAFKVLHDSSTFLAGTFEIDLNRTAIGLKNDMSLHCDRIAFDKNMDLALTNVMLFDSLNKKTIATCEKLKLSHFNLLSFVFYKNVLANAISLENAKIALTPDMKSSVGSPRHTTAGMNQVAISNVSLKNVMLNYTDVKRKVFADQLSVFLQDVKGDASGILQYKIRNIHVKRGSFYNYTPVLVGSMVQNLNFDGRSVQLKELDLQRDSLHIQLRDFTAEKLGEEPIQKSYRRWKIAQVRTLTVTGRLPRRSGVSPRGGQDFEVDFDKLSVDKLHISVNDVGKHVALNGFDISINNVARTNGGWTHGDIMGNFSDLLYQSRATTIRAEKASLNFPSGLKISNAAVTKADLAIGLPSIAIRSIGQHDREWSARHISAKDVLIMKEKRPVLKADSIRVVDTKLVPDAQPFVGRLEIFKPEISLVKNENETVHHKDNADGSLPFPEHIILHPGILHLASGRRIIFGKTEGNFASEHISCAYIRTETEKIHIQLNRVLLKDSKLLIDSLSMGHNDHWVKTNRLEDDMIKANLYGIHIENFNAGHWQKTASLKNASVSVARFDLDIKRDKRLADPPEIEKPITLTGLLKLPKNFSLKSVDLRKGRLQYTETSDKTGADGVVILEDISADLEFDSTYGHSHVKLMNAKTKLYNAGSIDLKYSAVDSSSFKLDVGLKDFDLTKLNQVVVPLQSLQIKSGHLSQYALTVTADADKAEGAGTISYKDLHLEIFKRTEPEKKTLGTELLTLLADGVIIKHSKQNAIAPVAQPRVKHKSIFNYWVKSAVHGAMGAIRKGKSKKNI